MDDITLWKIRCKYNNLIFPNIPNLLINFLMDNHLNYLDLILSKYINIDNIIYFLRNKEAASKKAALRVSNSFINKLNT